MATTDQTVQFDLISTWGDECGIFEYSHALLRQSILGENISQVFARKLPDGVRDNSALDHAILRNWTQDAEPQDDLKQALLQSPSDALWVQYHPSFFDEAIMEELAQTLVKTRYRRRVLTVHNPQKLYNSAFLHAFTDIVVHNEEALKDIGEINGAKTHVIPHFIYSREDFKRRENLDHFTIATLGFAAKNKRVPLLIEAFTIAHALNPDLRCEILTSPLPTHSAQFEISRITAAIKASTAKDAIKADFAPKSMPDLLSSVSGANLLCMTYSDTSESASGAARLGLAAGVPILRSSSSIFDDFPGGDFILEADNPHAIAEAILMLSQMPALLSEKRAEIDDIYDCENAAQIASRFAELLR